MTSRKRPNKPSRDRPHTIKAMTAAERMHRMRAYPEAIGLKRVVSGISDEKLARSGYSSHRLLEARSLAMHVVIAKKIDRDLRLLDIPRNNLKRWRARWENAAPAWHEEWCGILNRPWPQIAALITEPSEDGARLRQSSPFAGVLSPAERWRIYKAFRA